MKTKALQIRSIAIWLWLGAGALLTLSYVGVYRPMQASIDSRWGDVALTRARNVAGRATLRHAAEVRAARNRTRTSLAGQLVATNRQGEAVILGAVATTARRAGVAITSIEPSSGAVVQGKSLFSTRPIAIGVRGTFSALLAFLADVNDTRALFEVRDVAISPARTSAGHSQLLDMQVNAAVYRATTELSKETR